MQPALVFGGDLDGDRSSYSGGPGGPPGGRTFDSLEVGALVSNLILDEARCPDDETPLVVAVTAGAVEMRCSRCGSTGTWRPD